MELPPQQDVFSIITSASRAAEAQAPKYNKRRPKAASKVASQQEPASIPVNLTTDEAARLAKLRSLPEHVKNSLISRYLADIAREQAPPLPPILPHTATPPTTSTFVANAPFALPTVLPAPQHPQHPPMSSASSSSTWWHTSTHTTNSRDTSLDLVAGQYPPPPAHQYWAPHTSLGGCQLNPFTAAQSTPKMSTPLGIHVLHSHNGTALPPPSMASTSLPNNTYTPACISYPPNLPALWMMDGVVTLQGGSHVGGDDPSLSMPSVQSLSLPADVQPSKQWLDTSSLLHALSECGPADGGWNNPGVMQPPRT